MDHTSRILEYTIDFLSQIGFSPESVSVQVKLDLPNDIYQILLEIKEPAILIGYHGENLAALQFILGFHLRTRIDAALNISLNVNDYRERRQSSVEALADSAVARVVATNQPHSLPPMPANERRLVHLHLADHSQVTTTSEGEGRNRCVVIFPK